VRHRATFRNKIGRYAYHRLLFLRGRPVFRMWTACRSSNSLSRKNPLMSQLFQIPRCEQTRLGDRGLAAWINSIFGSDLLGLCNNFSVALPDFLASRGQAR